MRNPITSGPITTEFYEKTEDEDKLIVTTKGIPATEEWESF